MLRNNPLLLAITTFRGLLQQKIFTLFFLFALLMLGGSFLLVKFSFQEQQLLFQEMTLGILSFFLSLLAIVATALLLSQDTTEMMILARPLPRFEYLLGKLLGVYLLLLVSACVMGSVFFLLRFGSSIVASKEEAIALHDTSNFLLVAAILFALMKSWVLAAVTLLISTFATSNLFTIFIAVAVYFIGHLQATARALWMEGAPLSFFARVFFASVALLFPDLSAFNFTDHLTAGLFFSTMAMGFVSIFAYCGLACFLFQRREF